MDIIYDSKVFDSVSKEIESLNAEDILYLKGMSHYLTHLSYDIYSKVATKASDEKIADIFQSAAALKELRPVTVTAIIICRNEEKCIQRCLESIQACQFDEIIVIDTGSTDDTISILLSLQAHLPNIQIYNTQWEDNFAEARNYGLDLAKSDWVFFIDADEFYLNQQEYSVKELISFFSVYYQGNLCICPNIINSNKHELYNNPRIFRKDSGYRYYGNVHETLRRNSHSYEFVPNIGLNIKFGHDGYDRIIFSQKNKEERNVGLLFKAMEAEPDNPMWKCYLARDGMEKLRQDVIVQLCEEAIQLCKGKTTYFFTYNNCWAHTLLIDLYIKSKEADEAIPLLNNLKMNSLELDETDIYYREQLIYLIQKEKELEDNLTEIKNYRKRHSVTVRSALNTQGYHLDELIMRFNYLTHNMDEYHHYRNYLSQLNYLI
ncbi:glycosyltransferase family 2 protein [Paenibacillus macerans]|uniref:glycosyltransferase family 2 protein n=1 Tax=Paenibacillus macerans TaxID=44252 RepID=UPI002040E0D9|nr:glycosyltransferase family 2 protein [Paenibacillus macerans]MCM3699009.1 glycosyltransferase family 2 protein [Paenibacillus macerans]